jgi:hypothetical protein
VGPNSGGTDAHPYNWNVHRQQTLEELAKGTATEAGNNAPGTSNPSTVNPRRLELLKDLGAASISNTAAPIARRENLLREMQSTISPAAAAAAKTSPFQDMKPGAVPSNAARTFESPAATRSNAASSARTFQELSPRAPIAPRLSPVTTRTATPIVQPRAAVAPILVRPVAPAPALLRKK